MSGGRFALLLASARALFGCGVNTSDGVPGGSVGRPAARVVRSAPLEGFPPTRQRAAVRGQGGLGRGGGQAPGGRGHRPCRRQGRRGGPHQGRLQGRIDIRGASFAWWRPDLGLDHANVPSRIYVVDTRDHDLQAAVRANIVSDPATRDGSAFVHDIASGSAGWFEIPPFDVAASPEQEGAEHGTAIASVVARETGWREEGRNVAIVPMATPLGATRGVSSWLIDTSRGTLAPTLTARRAMRCWTGTSPSASRVRFPNCQQGGPGRVERTRRGGLRPRLGEGRGREAELGGHRQPQLGLGLRVRKHRSGIRSP